MDALSNTCSCTRLSKTAVGDICWLEAALHTEGMLASAIPPSRVLPHLCNEAEGNVSFRLREGGSHDEEANFDYTFSALCWFWNTGE